MSRRHHHTGREPRTEQMRLTAAGESMLDMLEVEIRAQRAYELTEQHAVDALNAEADDPWELMPVKWENTDPETRRDYRLHVIKTMRDADQLRGDRMARGLDPHPLPGGRFDESSAL